MHKVIQIQSTPPQKFVTAKSPWNVYHSCPQTHLKSCYFLSAHHFWNSRPKTVDASEIWRSPPGMSKNPWWYIMGLNKLDTNLNWLAGFEPSTVLPTPLKMNNGVVFWKGTILKGKDHPLNQPSIFRVGLELFVSGRENPQKIPCNNKPSFLDISLQGICWRILLWVVVSNMFYFHPYLGTSSKLTHIFLIGLKPPTTSTSLSGAWLQSPC